MRQMDVTMKKIGSTKFYITPFPAFTAARISGELSAVIAPMISSLAPLLGGSDTDADIMDSDIEQLLPVIADALGQLSGDKFEHLAKQLLVDYRNIAFEDEDGEVEKLTYDDANEIFCADLMGMILLGVEVVKINFGGFFKSLAAQFGNLPDSTEALVKAAKKRGTKNGETSI